MNSELIDTKFLASMQEKKPFVKKMFAVFVSQEPKRIQQIRESLESGDVETLRHLAHSLKGGSATIGAERVREDCLLLEKATKANDMDAARECFSKLEHDIHDTYAFMFDYIAEE
ncbi:Hpt domain-containing protein [Salidesulfovibrio brasiliensis]|uniref:Hpt domain-containing protein n=1 Tax=Salidesulfovibrio brasiliensis TaxID=221711 RepID=UPI0006D2B95D|nr:Hpt domain-containing protein [Salidesulfovibrio brasiliensis]